MILASLALAFQSQGSFQWKNWAVTVIGGLIALLGALTLAEWISGISFRIDDIIANEHSRAVFTSTLGRMAPNSAFSFLCAGLALGFVNGTWRYRFMLVQILCFMSLGCALLGLLVYVYGVDQAFSQSRITQMAAHTAVGLMLLSAAILATQPHYGIMRLINSDTSGGTVARQVLPAAIAAPLLIAFVSLYAVTANGLPIGLAFSLCTLSTVGILSILVTWCAVSLRRVDEERARATRMADEFQRITNERNRLDLEREKASRDLAIAAASALEASRAKSIFLANMSHELRTPLNALIGYSQMLEDHLFGALTERQQRPVSRMSQAGKHLLSMINSVLDISAIDFGKIELRLEVLDIAKVIAEIMDTVVVLADAKGIRMDLDIPSYSISVDDQRFRQILVNMISNAIKFTPPGGFVSIVAKHTPDPAGDFIRIAVKDSGVGIESEDIPKLFIEFGRLSGPYTSGTEGTGLGLALTKRLVELHGGRIRAVSLGRGMGTTFTLDFPTHAGYRLSMLPSDPVTGSTPPSRPGGIPVVTPQDKLVLSAEVERLTAKSHPALNPKPASDP